MDTVLTAKIRFLHIPKTAGSTFDECLFLQYLRPYLLRRQFVFSGDFDSDRKRFEALSPAARSRIALCTGHAPRVTGLAEIDALPTVALLRHPVTRVKSFCQHVSEGKSPNIYCRERDGLFDLDQFLASGRIQLENFQSRVVLGEQGYQLRPGNRGELARLAMTLLQSEFACFGITEDFDSSLLLFRRVLGWEGWPLYRSRNISSERARLHFDARHIARIEQLNALDLALYELAREAFYQQMSLLCPQLEEQLAQFRSALGRSQVRFIPIDLARLAGRLGRLLTSARPA